MIYFMGVSKALLGPDSQSSALPTHGIVADTNISLDNIQLGYFYDIPSPPISPSPRRDWDEAAGHVMEQYAELWTRLAEI